MKYSITEDIEKEKNSKRVMMIDHAATNAAELVHRFLNLAKKHEVTFSPVELNETVQRIAKICRDTTDKRIEIKTSYVMDDAFILADPVQIEHLLLNLCINAVQAMAHMGETGEPKKGVLGISIGSLNIDSVYAAGHSGVEQGDYWSVSVSDTGSGIDNEMKEKIFEPFFSTKEAGTGLGLVMVDSIVKQHGGFIELSSEKGRGSVFTVFIRQYKGQTKRPASKIEKQTDEKGAGIILLAEDDEIIREMTSDIFTENGYTVIAAENGEEALDIFRQRFFEIKGVFMDLAMPVLSGTDAFLAMREIYPDVKVLMTSGFASESSIRDAVDKGVAGFIRKPYSIQELLAKAREVFG
jgi:CheY-like chemotaxis protein